MQKQRVHAHCLSLVQQKIEGIEAAMREAQGAANEETKSSAGDKYETGRAMMHLEKEKLASQRAEAFKLQKVLGQIDAAKQSTQVALGSLVHTNRGWFFVAVGLGNIAIEQQSCFVISPAAPIGQAMWGRRVNDHFTFNGQTIEIATIR